MWANNCPAGLLKNKKLYTFVPGFARHFLFRAGKQCELTINFDGGRGIGHTQFEAVYTQYYARFVIIARRYVRDVAVAEDIVMESFASFWENRERIALETNLPAYVATSVRNNCLNWLNAQTLHLAKLHDIHSLQTRNIVASIRSLNACDPQRLFTDEIRAIVEREMLTMPQVTRQVFELSRFCGKTYAKIAEALGISQRRVTSEMQRALAIMRNALKDYFPVSLILWMLNVS